MTSRSVVGRSKRAMYFLTPYQGNCASSLCLGLLMSFPNDYSTT